jgi:CRP/FNR family cyclic AMP-dependent transcriptional regulator
MRAGKPHPRSDAKVFDPILFLAKVVGGRSIAAYGKDEVVFSQGDPADAIFYVQKGKVELKVVSKHAKEAVIAILGAGDFLGQGCLAGQLLRMATARAMSDCSIVRLEKAATIHELHEAPTFSELFLHYLLSRNLRMEEDLVDQLFNSSEKRLARVLLLLANFGKRGKLELVIPRISQQTLALMIGTTRPRISFFMNKFRRLGFINYNGKLEIHRSLLSMVLHD